MPSEPNPDTRTVLGRQPTTKTFITQSRRGLAQHKPRPSLSCRALMQHLDAHRTGVIRLLNGELVRVIRETVVEAAKTIDPCESDDGIYAIL